MVILAAGLTPAWQQILSFREFRVGAVNRAQGAMGCASGKVLNVGAAVHHLGGPSLTLSPVGGFTGQQIRADFAALGVPAQWIASEVATRVCTTLLDEHTGVTTELVENSAALPAAELTAYRAAYRTAAAQVDWVVLSGSLPTDTPADYYAHLLSETAVPVLLDVRGRELEACLRYKPWLVKPNREELAATCGWPLTTESQVLQAVAELRSAGAQHVVVSDGAGMLYAAGPEGVERFAPLSVQTVNPIGCGDSLAAGIAVATVEGRSFHDAVQFGIAAAAENATHMLPVRFSRAAVERRRAAHRHRGATRLKPTTGGSG